MGFCDFKCEEDSERYCCDCNKGSCDNARCSMTCLNETEEEKAVSSWYYENYVKPSEQ